MKFRFFAILLLFAGSLLAAPPIAPAPKPLLILQTAPGTTIVVRAISAGAQGDAVIAVLENGTRGAWQKSAFVTSLPWYTDTELRAGGVPLDALAKQYDDAAEAHPDARAELTAEADKVRALINDRDAQLDAFLSRKYEPDRTYTTEELRKMIANGEALTANAPARAVDIEAVLTPFREHLANVEAGKVFLDGAWLTPAEVQARSAEEEQDTRIAEFEQALSIGLPRQIFGATQTSQILFIGGALIAIPALLGAVLVFRRKRLAGLLLIVAPLAGGACYAWLMLATDVPWPPQTDEADSTAVSRVLLPDATPPPDGETLLTATEINAFLAKHVRLDGTPTPRSLDRAALSVAFKRDGLFLCEAAQWRGHPIRIRYDIDLRLRNGVPEITGVAAMIGKAPLARPLRDRLWESLIPPLSQAFATWSPWKNHAVSEISEQGIKFVAPAPAEPPARPKSKPAAVAPIPVPPETAATPEPSTPEPESASPEEGQPEEMPPPTDNGNGNVNENSDE